MAVLGMNLGREWGFWGMPENLISIGNLGWKSGGGICRRGLCCFCDLSDFILLVFIILL